MSDPLPHRQDLFLAAVANFARRSRSKHHLKQDPYATSKWQEAERNLWAPGNLLTSSINISTLFTEKLRDFSLKTLLQRLSGIKMCASAVYLNMQENTGPFDASINVPIQNVVPWCLAEAERERTGHRLGGPLQGFSRRWIWTHAAGDWCRVFLFIPRNHLISSDVHHTAGKEPPASSAPQKLSFWKRAIE